MAKDTKNQAGVVNGIKLFEYLEKLSLLSVNVRKSVKKLGKEEEWFDLEDESFLPVLDKVYLKHRADEKGTDENLFFSIQRYEIEKMPKLPKELDRWINTETVSFNQPEPSSKVIVTESFDDSADRKGLFKDLDQDSDIPDELQDWVTKSDKGIYKKIEVRDTELFFNDYPELQKLYDSWIENKWTEWQERNHDYLIANKAYDRFYALRSFLKTESDSYDLIWGHDVVTMKKGNDEIYHPTFFTPVTLDFDTDANIISVSADEQLKSFCDVSYIRDTIDEENVNLADIDELAERINTADDFDVWDKDLLNQYLRSFMRFMSPDGDSHYSNRDVELTSTSRPTAFNKHNLFLFKKSGKSWAEYAKKIQADIEENGELTPFLEDLITGEYVERESEEENESLFDTKLHDGELLFPLASNKEQQQISRQIDNSYGSVVQGPPGTGKTHTIANLVSRFLAQGKSVLVTSQTGQALSVLKQKLPTQIQNLAVSQVDDDSKTNDLQKAVSEINTNLSDTSKFTESTKKDARQELDLIRKSIAAKSKEYQQKLLLDSTESIEVGVDVFNPMTAAQLVAAFETKHSFRIIDAVDYDLDLPFTQVDFDNYVDALKKLDKSAWEYASYDDFPTVGSLPKLKIVKDYIETRDSLSSEEEKLHKQYIPNEAQLESIDSIINYIEEYKKQVENVDALRKTLKDKGVVSVDKTIETIVKKTDREEVAALLTQIEQIRKHLNSFDADWEKELLKIVGNKSEKQRWDDIVKLFDEKINIYRKADTVLIGKDVLVGGLGYKEALSAITSIRVKSKNGKFPSKISFMLDAGIRKLLKNVSVDGDSVATIENLNIINSYFDKQRSVQELSVLWSQAFESLKDKKDFIDPFSIVDFEADVATVRRIVSFGDRKVELAESLTKFSSITDTGVKSVHSFEDLQQTFKQVESLFVVEEIETILNGLKQELSGEHTHSAVKDLYTYIDKKDTDRIIATKQKLVELNVRKLVSSKLIDLEQKVYTDSLNTVLNSKKVSTKISQFSTLIEKSDIGGIKHFYESLPVLIEEQKLAHKINKLDVELNNFIPETLKKIRLCIQNEEEFELPLVDNWTYVRLSSWLDHLHKGDSIYKLVDQIEILKNKEKDQVRKLIEISAWINLKDRVTKTQKEALASFALSMKQRGKGTGKYAAKHLNDAKNALMIGKDAVPVWIMPINAIHQLFPDPKAGMFDVVIFDEASQVDARGLNIAYLGKKLLIVGDDEQVSPTSFTNFAKVTDLITRYISGVPNCNQFSTKSSLFDIAKIKMTETVTLTEHFRSIEEIIGFSNKLSYDGSLKILRDQLPKDRLDPVLEAVYVDAGYTQTNVQVNQAEAEAIVEKIKEFLNDKKYSETKIDGVTRATTIGVISLLGKDQSKLITKLISENISSKEIEARQIICGDPYVFQGDERDIILLSMVKAPDLDKPDAAISPYTSTTKAYRQRINVAMSRARNKMVLFHSIPKDKITNRNDLRKQVIDWFYNYKAEDRQSGLKKVREEVTKGRASEFEYAVAEIICNKGFTVIPQYEVAGYRIDLVVQGENAKLAIECDGDQYHNGLEKWHEDIERQQIIERSGWQFWRLSGSSFYRHKHKALDSLWEKLEELEIKPTI
jgi:very-short-patch-repair endonuclease